MIFFKCGKAGHKDECYPILLDDNGANRPHDERLGDPTFAIPANRPEYMEEFGPLDVSEKTSEEKINLTWAGKGNPIGLETSPPQENEFGRSQNEGV